MKWFTSREVACPCGCYARLSERTKEALDELRELYGKPIYIEQAATCYDYSVNKIGRNLTSTHIDSGAGALAVDVKHKTFKSKEDFFDFICCAKTAGFKGIGLGVGHFDVHEKDTRTHLDMRSTEDIVTWVYY